MELVEQTKQKIRQNKEATAFFTLFTVIQLVILSANWNKPMTWDSAIYIAMGKYLFSLGEIGLWESFRPPLIPLITGFIWKLGLPLVPTLRILHTALTVGGLVLIYRQLKTIFNYRTALYTTGITMATAVFIDNVTTLLTGVISALMVVTAVNYYVKDNYYASGTLSGLAFLTRFPSILVSPALGLSEAVKNYEEPKEALITLVKYSIPVALLLGIYFGLNQYFLGDALQPITGGLSVPPSDATSIPGTYYLSQLATNPFILLSIPGTYLILKERKKKYMPYVSALAVFFLFFELYPHKEVRYALLFLPFLALTGSYALRDIQERLEISTKAVTALIAVVMVLASAPIYSVATYENEAETEFYKQFQGLEGTVATNVPGPIQYGDFDYQALPQGYITEIVERGGIDYYGINSCAWYDTSDEAMKEIEKLNETLSQYERIYNGGGENCNYRIYEVEN